MNYLIIHNDVDFETLNNMWIGYDYKKSICEECEKIKKGIRYINLFNYFNYKEERQKFLNFCCYDCQENYFIRFGGRLIKLKSRSKKEIEKQLMILRL